MRKDEVFSQIGFKEIWKNLTFLIDVIFEKKNVENNVYSSDIWFAINATQQWLSLA